MEKLLTLTNFDKRKKYKTECLINGELIKYDACSSNTLEKAKKELPNFNYIGSGYIFYIDGVKNVSEKELHFFIKKF